MSRPAAETPIRFRSSDGVALVGDLAVPDHPTAAAIVCHPHPQYGGNRHNDVVRALCDALSAAGVAAMRFDFRADFDHGRGEALDAVGAIDAVAAAVPDVPVVVAGYSFGAAIALTLHDDRIRAKVLVAPPLAMMPVDPAIDVPMLALTPEYDQFSPPERSGPIVDSWADTTHHIVAGADHFLAGHTAVVADTAVAWLRDVAGGTSGV